MGRSPIDEWVAWDHRYRTINTVDVSGMDAVYQHVIEPYSVDKGTSRLPVEYADQIEICIETG